METKLCSKKHISHKIIAFFCIALFTHGFIGTAWGEEKKPIGTVALINGTVWRTPANTKKKVTLKPNAQVFQGDDIVTGKNSYVKILMIDDTIFDLGDNTKFSFTKFKMDKNKKEKREANYNITYGKLRSLFTVKSDPKKVKIKTPDIVMGVRGTEILSDVYNLKGNVPHTNVALLSGKIDITPRSNDLKSKMSPIVLVAGQNFDSQKVTQKRKTRLAVNKLSRNVMNRLKNNSPGRKIGVFLSQALKRNVASEKDTQGNLENAETPTFLPQDTSEKKRPETDSSGTTQKDTSSSKRLPTGTDKIERKKVNKKKAFIKKVQQKIFHNKKVIKQRSKASIKQAPRCQFRNICTKFETTTNGTKTCVKRVKIKYPAGCK